MQEIFKDITGYEDLYQVSNIGRVKGLERKVKHSINGYKIVPERILKSVVTGNRGYLFIVLSKLGKQKTFILHRLVALAFIPNPLNKRTINHKNGIKTHNSINNLEWNTYSENNQHAIDTKLRPPQKRSR